jgi:hypothetical protein
MKNLKYRKQTKHIDTKYYFIHEKWKTLEVEISYVHIHNQTSNLLTNPPLNYMFQKFHSYMGMVALNSHLLHKQMERHQSLEVHVCS